MNEAEKGNEMGMKVCPLCKSTVDEPYSCPICHTTLTYEPDCYSHREKFVFNKYFVLYLAGKCWFSVLCLLIVLARMLIVRTAALEMLKFCVPFAVISLGISLFERQLVRLNLWRYTEVYATYSVKWPKFVFGFLAALFSFVIR